MSLSVVTAPPPASRAFESPPPHVTKGSAKSITSAASTCAGAEGLDAGNRGDGGAFRSPAAPLTTDHFVAGLGAVPVPLHAVPTSRSLLHPTDTTFQPFALASHAHDPRHHHHSLAEFVFPDGVRLRPHDATSQLTPPPPFFTFVTTDGTQQLRGHVLVVDVAVSPAQAACLDMSVLPAGSSLVAPLALCFVTAVGRVPELHTVLSRLHNAHVLYHHTPPPPPPPLPPGQEPAPWHGGCADCGAAMAAFAATAKQPPPGRTLHLPAPDCMSGAGTAALTAPSPPASPRACPPPGGGGAADLLDGQLSPWDTVAVTGPPATTAAWLRNPMDLGGDDTLRAAFRRLSIPTFLRVWEAVLLERRVLLHSADVTTLARMSDAVLQLLAPVQYQHTYIPVLPLSHRYNGVVESPMPFLIGMTTRRFVGVQSGRALKGVLVVDVDRNRVTGGLPRVGGVSVLPRRLVDAVTRALRRAGCDTVTASPAGGADSRDGEFEDVSLDSDDDAPSPPAPTRRSSAAPAAGGGAYKHATDDGDGDGDGDSDGDAAAWADGVLCARAKAAAVADALRLQRLPWRPEPGLSLVRARFFAVVSQLMRQLQPSVCGVPASGRRRGDGDDVRLVAELTQTQGHWALMQDVHKVTAHSTPAAATRALMGSHGAAAVYRVAAVRAFVAFLQRSSVPPPPSMRQPFSPPVLPATPKGLQVVPATVPTAATVAAAPTNTAASGGSGGGSHGVLAKAWGVCAALLTCSFGKDGAAASGAAPVAAAPAAAVPTHV